jgi:sugar (pentulose or hexulose) kinase
VSVNDLLGGLDVGTTSVKALLMTFEGVEVAHGRAPTTWERTVDGVEADPFAIVAAANHALADALASVPAARVTSLGVASMGEAGVLVGADEQPLVPVVAWHDNRDFQQLADLAESVGGQRFSIQTGLPLRTQWSVTKHRWFHENVPSTRVAIRRYNIAEWVARNLGADAVCELSLASRTGWLDLKRKALWDEALVWSGAKASLLGDLVEAGAPIGKVSSDCALQQLRGATLTIAGHDHQAATVGAGAFDDQVELDSCGTADAIVRTTFPELTTESLEALTAAGVTVGWHAVRDRWCVLGATQGGLILQGIMARLGVAPDRLGELDRLAALGEPAAATVTLGPESDDISISGSDAPGDVWRAATEAVTLQLRDLAEMIAAATGPRGDLVVTGGWSNSSALMAAKASALGPLWRTETLEAGARGAAILGGLAHGTYSSHHDVPRPSRTRLRPAVTEGRSTAQDRQEEPTE